LSIKTELFTDIYNLIGIIPFNHNNGETIYNYETMKNREKERRKIGLLSIGQTNNQRSFNKKEKNGMKKKRKRETVRLNDLTTPQTRLFFLFIFPS